MEKLISTCPVCGDSLHISVLKCGGCGLELKNDFPIGRFDRLSEEQYNFLLDFLKSQGNLKAVQEKRQISYPAAKKRLSDLLYALDLTDTEDGEESIPDMKDWDVHTDSRKASDIVKAKLISCGGKATVQTLQGKKYSVWVETPDTFACDKIISYTYDIFDVIVEHIVAQGGKARKGSGRGHLGDPHCEEDTIAAAILKNYWKSDTGLDPAFVMLAILEWAGIVHNRRGYAELTQEYKMSRGENSNMKLAIQFEKELEEKMLLAKRECGYPATRFHQMLKQYGGVGTAKRLIREGIRGNISEGFTTLAYIEGRPDLTMEHSVCKTEYRSLFTQEEIAHCKRLLKSE